jgi:3-methyladenine DNA glycosylase/8-oxoguanine DNA glycosylase
VSRAERLQELAAAKRRIVRADPAFAEPIKRLAPCTFGLQKSGQTNYQSLVRAVIAQQVSVAAAKTIYQRLHEKCAPRQRFEPLASSRQGCSRERFR